MIFKTYQLYQKIFLLFFFTAVFPLSAESNKNISENLFPPTNLSTSYLNSERIKLKYGSYRIEVLKSDSKIRLSNLYFLQEQNKITATFAVVLYPQKIDAAFVGEHAKVVGGQSMGAVFKANGWKIVKKGIYIGVLTAHKNYQKLYQLMGNIHPTTLAFYVYDFYILKDNRKFKYATLAEIYRPDYLNKKNLEKMYKCI